MNQQTKKKICIKTKLLLTPKKTNEVKDNKPCILAVLRHIFAIFSSQISTMKETSDAILNNETTNQQCEIYPRDIRFQSSLLTIHDNTNQPITVHLTRAATGLMVSFGIQPNCLVSLAETKTLIAFSFPRDKSILISRKWRLIPFCVDSISCILETPSLNLNNPVRNTLIFQKMATGSDVM